MKQLAINELKKVIEYLPDSLNVKIIHGIKIKDFRDIIQYLPDDLEIILGDSETNPIKKEKVNADGNKVKSLEQFGSLMKPSEVKKALRWSNKTTYSLVKTPGIGTQVGNRFYFLKDRLIQWLENGGSSDVMDKPSHP
jgi:hypothetical protein